MVRVVKVRPGLTRLVYSDSEIKKQRTGFAKFKPLRIQHGTKEGSPLMHSRKEVNKWLNQNKLISPLFTD